jgi:hypothetical protein
MFNATETWDDHDALRDHPSASWTPVRAVLPQSMADRRVYWVFNRTHPRVKMHSPQSHRPMQAFVAVRGTLQTHFSSTRVS